MKTLQSFIKSEHIKFQVEWADNNPHMSDMPGGSTHWKCKIRKGNRQMTAFFSMGPAHNKEPECEDLLDCLASGSSSVDRDFSSWASELGYGEDSRKPDKIYKICVKQAESLKRVLGDTAYECLLFDTERL